MGADITIRSLYEQRHKDYDVDKKLLALQAARGANKPEAEIEQLKQAYVEAYEKADEGCYFRDSYNDSSLAWVLGLSYWQASEDCDEHGLLSINMTKHWHDTVKAADVPALVRQACNNAATNDKLGLKRGDEGALRPTLYPGENETVEQLIEYFTNKQTRFVALLAKCLELNEGPSWSV